jgi:hypothetical protein
MNALNTKRRMTHRLLLSLLVAFIFACLVTIGGAYRKPHIPPSVEKISGIDFPEGLPGDSVYNESTIELQAYDIFVNLEINSSDLRGPNSFTILASNLSASCDNITFVSLGHDYRTVWRYLLPGTYEIRIYWKLDIPIPSVAGKYDFAYWVKLSDAREGNVFDQFFLCLHIIEYDLPTFLGLLFSSLSLCFLLVEKFSGVGNSVENSRHDVGKMARALIRSRAQNICTKLISSEQ